MINFNQAEQSTINNLIARSFKEDLSSGDVTTDAIVEDSVRAKAVWISKDEGIVAGLGIAQKIFQELDPQVKWNPNVIDGDIVAKGSELVELEGSCRAILSAERIALNIVQRMSGIATKTHHLVEAIASYPAQILDTRKTAPGLRLLDKYAVAAGGGTNHRMGLYDLAMIKDNHIVVAGSIAAAVKKVRSKNPDIRIEVETTSLNQVTEALEAGADIIMLDNMSTDKMEEAVSLIGKKAATEASGNITRETIQSVAETGVDYISVGALTHSVEAFDISQQVQKIYN